MRKFMLSVAATLVAATAAPMSAQADDNLNFHFLYVGQGDMTVVECPGSKNFIVVDAGSGQDSTGAKANLDDALPKIIGKGANVEFVLTHDHSDHANLAGYVKGIVQKQGATWIEGGPVSKAAGAYKDEPVAVNACGNDKVAAAVVYAQPAFKRGNNESTVLGFAYGGHSVLLMGDAEAAVEKKLAGKWGEVTLVKIAHHGSSSSTTPAFLAEIKPKVAFVSAGRHQRYFHPRCDTMVNLTKAVVVDLDKSHDLFCYSAPKTGAVVSTTKAILVTRPFNSGVTYNFKAWLSDKSYGGSAYDSPLPSPASDELGDDNADDDV